uniref:Uncharacterized protein n=1 Tax=Anopheles gambiae TaxID=7165 RepID=A0A0E4C723_ANOGA
MTGMILSSFIYPVADLTVGGLGGRLGPRRLRGPVDRHSIVLPYGQSTSDKGPRKDGRRGPEAGESILEPMTDDRRAPRRVQTPNSQFSAATTSPPPPTPTDHHLPFTGGLNSSYRLGAPIPLIRHCMYPDHSDHSRFRVKILIEDITR